MTRPVVLDPGLLLRAALGPAGRPPLEAWRDGQIRPVLTRRTLAHALGLLREAGLSRSTLERWALWLSDSQKVLILPDGDPGLTMREEHVDAARRAEASILTDQPGDFGAATGLVVEKPASPA